MAKQQGEKIAVLPANADGAGRAAHISPARSASKANHLEYLDGIRASAALYVVGHHAVRMVTGTLNSEQVFSNAPLMFNLVHFFESLGQAAVAVFITLSGFCLMLPVLRSADGTTLKEGAGVFLIKRARRILPPYFAAVAFAVVLIALTNGFHDGGFYQTDLPGMMPHRLGAWDFIAHVLLLQDLFHGPNTSIDTPLWSISAEWRIYLLFPMLLFSWRRIGAVKTVGLAVVASMILNWAGSHVLARYIAPITVAPAHFVPEYIGLFALGALGAAVSKSVRPEFVVLRNRVPWAMVFYAGTLMLVLMTIPQNEHRLLLLKIYSATCRNPEFMNVVIGLLVIGGLVAFEKGQLKPLRAFFSWKPLAAVGLFSYSLYLIHYPIELALYQWFIAGRTMDYAVQVWTILALSTVVSVGIAYLFFYLFERPSHHWAKSVGKAETNPSFPVRSATNVKRDGAVDSGVALQ